MEIRNDRLIDVAFQQAPNISAGRTIEPTLIVIHYTAGRSAER